MWLESSLAPVVKRFLKHQEQRIQKFLMTLICDFSPNLRRGRFASTAVDAYWFNQSTKNALSFNWNSILPDII